MGEANKTKKIIDIILNFSIIISLIVGVVFYNQKNIATIFFIVAILLSAYTLIKIFFQKQPSSKNIEQNINNNVDSFQILESINEGVILINSENKIKYINPVAQSLTGWSKNDAIDQLFNSVLKIVSSDKKPLDDSTNPVIKSKTSNSQINSRDFYIENLSGKLIPIGINSLPVDSELLVTFRDITKEISEDKEQKEFISTASHEMRTPVAAIDGYLGLIVNPKICQIDNKAREYAMKAQESSKHLGELFRNLLTISKTEDGRAKLNPVVIDLVDFVRNCITDFQSSASAKGLYLQFIPDLNKQGDKIITPSVYSYADYSALKEVVNNLIENAIKYTKHGGVTLDVNFDENNNSVISIKDTGIGIPSDDLPHLFEKFYRVDNRDTREIGGTGLGLYLTKKIIEKLEGSINVNSEFGNGTEFIIKLKRLSDDEVRQLNHNQNAFESTVFANNQQPVSTFDNISLNSNYVQPANDTSTYTNQEPALNLNAQQNNITPSQISSQSTQNPQSPIQIPDNQRYFNTISTSQTSPQAQAPQTPMQSNYQTADQRTIDPALKQRLIEMGYFKDQNPENNINGIENNPQNDYNRR